MSEPRKYLTARESVIDAMRKGDHEIVESVAITMLLTVLALKAGISNDPDVVLMLKVLNNGSQEDDDAFMARMDVLIAERQAAVNDGGG